MNTNQKKAEQLGMPAGTAANRLRKQLLFKYVQRADDDYCFVCGKAIESVEEFTIEHKQPWFNRDADLFWNLENIAFSHSWCNVRHYDGYDVQRKIGPEGTAWCVDCKDFLPVSQFHKLSKRWNGLAKICKMHRSIRDSGRNR